MAQWLSWGDGSDGSPNAISGTVNTYASCTGTAGQSVLTTSLAASANDQILIHQTQHATAAGTWEIVKVLSDGGATLNLQTALVNSYSTGAQAVLIPQYTGGDISGAVTGAAWDGTVGGIIAIMSNGDLTISGSITAPAGFRGGSGGLGASDYTGKQGEGLTGAGTNANAANGSGGGGGTASPGGFKPGGGGAGYAAAGTAGTNASSKAGGVAGASCGIATLTTLLLGSGGGQAAYYNSSPSAGNGGGIILIIAKNFTLSGNLYSNGTNGQDASTGYGGSGGGAGGSVLIKTQIGVLGTNKITVAAGSGGAGAGSDGAGGAGSVGRIRCDYFTSLTGSTTPTLSSAQDTSLFVPSNNFFMFF